MALTLSVTSFQFCQKRSDPRLTTLNWFTVLSAYYHFINIYVYLENITSIKNDTIMQK